MKNKLTNLEYLKYLQRKIIEECLRIKYEVLTNKVNKE